MSRATFENITLKDAGIRLLPKLNEFIRARKTTESFLVTIEQVARWSGLVRRNGRIDDNQAYRMMTLANVPVSKIRRYGMRCWDAREALQALAKWTGSWAWMVE
ncbi:hypothetical protein [Bifidobacterium breve]|uniref:hypothetical protein n=1 Tax=Bifidobacterium breve TaxID=1685 RepID=UPI0030F40936